ncbi:MAG TPA: arsenite methyltransferase [Actinomycetota bacterium]|nr:arsenite methyltransferase [Actinomycetota bacterium]
MSEVREEVRSRYAEIAKELSAGASCCGDQGTSCCGDTSSAEAIFGSELYQISDREGLPALASMVSLGCGNPVAVADLNEGDVVLDLGSGAGLDVLLSARRVGTTGKVYGLDMTDEMLSLAERNRIEAGAENVEFLKGTIEDIPLPSASLDVVISNCVINLSDDKPKVLAEVARVLRPGGRIGISDIVADDSLSASDRAERGSYVGCIAGALSFGEYRSLLGAAGMEQVSIEPTHEVAPGMFSAIIKGQRSFSEN